MAGDCRRIRRVRIVLLGVPLAGLVAKAGVVVEPTGDGFVRRFEMGASRRHDGENGQRSIGSNSGGRF